MKIAIITGASSGLGKDFYRIVTERYPELDEIWVVARRKDRLEELHSPNVKTVPLAYDLSDSESFKQLESLIEEKHAEVMILINNAGFGYLGNLIDEQWDKQCRCIDVNCRALTAISTIAIKHMPQNSFIINSCSIASFAPNPRMTVYCSTKAYVLSFSKSLRYELKDKKINVLACCPGPMDTEFLAVAGITEGASRAFDTLPRCNPADVAKKSILKAEKGHGVYTPRAFFKLYRVLAKLLPHSFIMNFSKT